MHRLKSHNEQQKDYFSDTSIKTIQTVESDYVMRHLQHVIDAAKLTEADEILEVGGIGRFTQILHQNSFNITASDLSSDLIHALNKNEAKIKTLVLDIASLPDNIGKFDKIIGFFMLHHLVNLDKIFVNLAQLLKPEGTIVFCEPNAFYLPFYLQILLTPSMSWEVDKGVVNMRPNFIEKAMRQAGFIDFEVNQYGYFPPALYNKKSGKQLEQMLERLPLPHSLRAFQVFKAKLAK